MIALIGYPVFALAILYVESVVVAGVYTYAGGWITAALVSIALIVADACVVRRIFRAPYIRTPGL
jgi:hypothetical protein